MDLPDCHCSDRRRRRDASVVDYCDRCDESRDSSRFLFGFWSAAWFDAAADALDCVLAILDAVNGHANVSAQLSTQLAGHQAQTIEALRMLGEHMIDRSSAATDLLRVVAENTESLARRAG